MPDYIELTFTVEPKEQGSDVLIAQLSEIDFESFVENSAGFCAYIQEEQFDEDALKTVLQPFESIFKFSYSIKNIPQQNWNKEWESNFQPIDVAGKCYIRAPFHEAKKGYVYDIIIEPKMSFGTGHHDTTQLMIEKLMSLDVKGKSLLDMGCGTGVLAIVASMMGANPATAIDIDEWSFINTEENLLKNNVHNVVAHQGDAALLEGKQFNFILANINKNILKRDMQIYSAALLQEGEILMSGFFETDCPELIEHASRLNWKLKDQKISNGWAVLHFVK